MAKFEYPSQFIIRVTNEFPKWFELGLFLAQHEITGVGIRLHKAAQEDIYYLEVLDALQKRSFKALRIHAERIRRRVEMYEEWKNITKSTMFDNSEVIISSNNAVLY